jgi:hypothetical protein
MKRGESIARYAAQPIGSLPRFWRVAVACRRCGRRNEVPVAYLTMVGRVEAATTLAEFAHGLRCSICNSRRVVVAIEGTAIKPRVPAPPERQIGPV